MAYLYKTYLYKDTTRVIPIPPDNTENLADFVDNHKSSAFEVDDVILAETVFQCDCSYEDFDAFITDPFDWGDVKYIAKADRYELYLLTDNSL
jgi:hypothetical protein